MKPLSNPVPAHSIEPLEGRIAPAIMHIGATGTLENATDTEYHEDISVGSRPDAFDDLNFIDTSTATDAISLAVDSPATMNTYYVRLNAGDSIHRFTNVNNYAELITVKSGSAIVYFTDINNDNEYNDGELTGLSLSANASVVVNGSVNGDIVTNLNTQGTAAQSDDTVDMAGLVGPKQGIKRIELGGNSVLGSILSGGDIKTLIAVGSAENVLAGSAAHGKTFDFFTVAGGEGVVSFVPGVGVKGASIRNVEIGALNDFDAGNNPIPGMLAAGAGGAGAAGGSLNNIKITGDADGFTLMAGAGGDADTGAGKFNGGVGGKITKVLVAGVSDESLNNDIIIKAGPGGDGASTGRGGAGGLLNDVRVAFEVSGGRTQPSDNLLKDNVRVEAGAGGEGKTGGAGGRATAINIRSSTPDEVGGDVELAVIGGAGGSSVSPGGKAGVGGKLNNIEVRNQITATDTDILLQGGAGGTVVPAGGASTGAAGGGITKVKVLGSEIQVVGGDGSTGRIGGKGGGIKNLTILDDDSILAQSVLLSAGRGGDGLAGNAGGGGNIETVNVPGSDLLAMLVNPATGGNGGNSTGGKGGKGGLLRSIIVSDIDSPSAAFGTFNARAGLGGDGDKGGGAGGLINRLELDAVDLNVFVAAGPGGDALVSGAGGKGGQVTAAQVVTFGTVNAANVTGSIAGGSGGDGAGTNKPGGKGGDIRKSLLNLNGDETLPQDGDGALIAGAGGSGSAGTGAAGGGGSIFSSAIFATQGSASIIAGDAGTIGGRPGKGGSIVGNAAVPIGLRGDLDISALAGDGSFGGAGGNISFLSFGNGDAFGDPLAPTPAGTILIHAGAGSQGPKTAGKGGSLNGINGGPSSGIGELTSLLAGDGGGDVRTGASPVFTYTGTGKAAPGGSITNVTLANGGNVDGLVIFEAGDGGHSGTAATGKAGGAIKNVGINNLAAAAVLRSFGAGDGGDANNRGGTGGTISGVEVLGHEIGVMSGKIYGYTEMGGLFAGAGGAATTMGKAGSVTDVSADSIAAIVAGKSNTPQLAERISKITLNGGNQLLFRNNSFVPGSPFQLSFNGETTPDIPGNATAEQIQNALNLLPGVAGAGGITVINFTSDGGYVVQFGSSQVATTDASLSAGDIEVALESLPTVLAKGGVTTSDQPDGIHVQFTGGGADAVIVPGATTSQIAAALNSTGLNAFGTFTVSQTTTGGIPGDYTITYKTIATGNQSQITGVENVPIGLVVKVQGAIGSLSSIETRAGQFGLGTTETRSGSDTVVVQETVRGEFNFVASQITTGVTSATAEVQQFTLNPVNIYPNSVFTLSFNADQTTQIGTTGTDLAIAAAADAALELLPSIQALSGPVGNKVDVVPSAAGPRTFNIIFGIDDGDVNAVQGRYLLPETQRIETGTLNTIAGATYEVTFGTSSTGQLPANTTAAELDTALELLFDIQALPGIAGNKVTVTGITTHTFDITFNSNGNQPAFTGTTSLPEIQTLNLASALAVPGGTFRLFFDGASTFTNETTPLLMPGASDAVTAGVIQTALNALDSVKATLPGNTGTVSVAALGGGTFSVNFAANGEQPNIVATAVVPELQNLDLNPINTIANSEFTLSVQTTVPVDETRQYAVLESDLAAETRPGQLSILEFPVTSDFDASSRERYTVDRDFLVTNFAATGRLQFAYNGSSSALLLAGATAGQIDTAIENIPTIAALAATFGGAGNKVTVTVPSPVLGTPNSFEVRFNGAGNLIPDLQITALVPEVQQLDLSNTEPVSRTVLRFQGEDTILLPAVPVAAEVDAALEALASIQALDATPGDNVTVTQDTPTTVSVTFTNPGNIPGRISVFHEVLEEQTLDLTRLAGTGATFTLTGNGLTTAAFNEATVTAADIDTALDAFYDDGIASNGTDDITVTASATPNQFIISFTTLRGDQAPVTALATLGTGTTARLPGNADAATIETALDAITVGGVTVTSPGMVAGVPIAGSFDILFGDTGNQPVISVATFVHEVQTIDVYDVGQFLLQAGGVSTGPLDPPVALNDPFNPTVAELADLTTKAQAVEDALNALPAIISVGLVDVEPATRTVVIDGVPTVLYENTAFDVSFRGDGDQNALSGTQPETMPVSTKIEGTATVPEQQIIRYFPKNQLNGAAFNASNLVGAIADIDEHNANRFHFINLDGSVDGLGQPTFTLGDRPIDGLVMAKIFDQATVNFTPEARLTASGFFDNDNLL